MHLSSKSFATLGSVLAIAAVAPQAIAQKVYGRIYNQTQEAHFEHLDDPWLPGFGLSGPAYVHTSAGITIRQVNVNSQGNNIVGDAANEPSIAIDPTNPQRMLIGWRQFDTISSNFRQAGRAYTSNGGKTWTNPGVLTPGVFRSDPVMGSDYTGKFYYLSLKDTFYCDIFVSTNGGVTFSGPIAAVGGDKQWMTIDNTGSSGKGFLYQAWSTAGNNYGGRQFSRSTNGGTTWINPIFITNSPIWGTLAVGPNGELYVCGTADAGSSTYYFVRSSNAKNSGQTPTWDLVRTVNLGGANLWAITPNPGGLGGQVWIRCDRSNGPRKGWIYMLCTVNPSGNDPADCMFTRSTDGGNTWSAPKRINDDPTNTNAWQWFGTMDVAPTGRIDVVWNDSRGLSSTQAKLYYSCSYDGGTTWTPNVAITPAFNTTIGWPNQNKIGDYYDMVSDAKGANVAFSATFNGEQDVYFVHIPAPPQKVGPG